MFAIQFWNSSVRMKHLFSGGGCKHKDSAPSAIYFASCSATADRSEVTIHLRVRLVSERDLRARRQQNALCRQILIPTYDRSGA